jgi:hypothetical protein
MEIQTAITLLTITVILLSIVIITLLVATTLVMLKLRQTVKQVNLVTHNIAEITTWMTPLTVVKTIKRVFKK